MLISLVGGWLALRRWPDAIGPHLPPGVAFRLASLGKAELTAARVCFDETDPHWIDHPLTAGQLAVRHALLNRALGGSRNDQVLALKLISHRWSDSSSDSLERNALVFALVSSSDDELRSLARERWSEGIDLGLRFTARLGTDIDASDLSPLAPDRWVAGPAATIAWRMDPFLNTGYDHRTPNKYQKRMRALMDRLLALEAGQGRFSPDERDNALALGALVELFAMTGDATLKPVVERCAAVISHDLIRRERAWQENTTQACLDSRCFRSLVDAGVLSDDIRKPLRASFVTWLATRTTTAPPQWYARGVAIAATESERWGAVLAGRCWLNVQDKIQPASPVWLTDPTASSPFGRFLIRIGALIVTDPDWKAAFNQRTQTLANTQILTRDHLEPEGGWPARGEVSAMWESAFSYVECSMRWPHFYVGPP